MDTEFAYRVIAFLLFAVAGFFLSMRLSAPKHPLGWVAWLAALVFVGYFGANARLIAIRGFVLYISNFLQGIVFGLLSGWLFRSYPKQSPQNSIQSR
jgi:uncharacterized membrane protein YjjB (DUF3815 family)